MADSVTESSPDVKSEEQLPAQPLKKRKVLSTGKSVEVNVSQNQERKDVVVKKNQKIIEQKEDVVAVDSPKNPEEKEVVVVATGSPKPVKEHENVVTTDSPKEFSEPPSSPLLIPEKDKQRQDAEKVSNNGLASQKHKEKEPKVKSTAAPSSHEPTSSLYIENFKRPLTIPAVRNLLEQYGKIEHFWMNKIKSHCYVKYDSVEAATMARDALWRVQWPPETGQPLIPEFITFEHVSEKIAEEEAKEASGKSRLDSNGSVNGNTSSSGQPSRQNVYVPLEKLFKKTETTPSLYYKPIPQVEADAKMKELARKRGRRS